MKLELLDQNSVCSDCGAEVTAIKRWFVTSDGGETGFWCEQIDYGCGSGLSLAPRYITGHKPITWPMDINDYVRGNKLCRRSEKYRQHRRDLDTAYNELDIYVRNTFNGEILNDILNALNHRSEY